MRLANVAGRTTIISEEGLIDVQTASNGAFSSSVDKAINNLDALKKWFYDTDPAPTTVATLEEIMSRNDLGPVIETPSQIFAIGLNYRTHAEEIKLVLPTRPMVFTKFPSSITGANSTFKIPSETTDWEAELVIVFGKRVRNISVEDALSCVAGYCTGNDLSDRELQMAGSPAQFSLGKSHENFSPIGPWLTTTDDIEDPNDLRISCSVNGTKYQNSNTSDMVFTVPELISYVSSVCEIRPGDLMFTGSPHGVGQGQTPKIFLKPGDVVETTIDGLGTLRNKGI